MSGVKQAAYPRSLASLHGDDCTPPSEFAGQTNSRHCHFHGYCARAIWHWQFNIGRGVGSLGKDHSSLKRRYSQDDVSSDSDGVASYRFKAQHQPPPDGTPPVHKLSRPFSAAITIPARSTCKTHVDTTVSSSPVSEVSSPQRDPQPNVAHFQELSLELADSVQMVVQTLLQISPAQILDPAKEQYAACSLLVPTTCMSAMLTTMKSLNFVSANMSDLFLNPDPSQETTQEPFAPSAPAAVSDFDIAETLQGVGDVLSGCAAQAGVDLVLFHGDVGLRHVAVRGEEFALSTTLTHVIRQVISTARQEDSVDVGLSIKSPSDDSLESPTTEGPTEKRDDGSLPSYANDGHVVCVFEIAHNFGESNMGDDMATPTTPDPCPLRPRPNFTSALVQRLFLRTKARNNLPGRVCEIAFRLERGSLSAINARTAPVSDSTSPLLSGTRIAKEPTLEELTQFSESLRGKKATLYACGSSSFAHHLTSYLTAWGLDVSHVSPEQGGENCGAGEVVAPASPESAQPSNNSYAKAKNRQWNTSESYDTHENAGVPSSGARSPSLSFVFIDDDVSVLREQIQKFRAEQLSSSQSAFPRKRPLLNHRPKSTSQVARAAGYGPSSSIPSSGVASVVVHFTSLTNYKLVRDVVQCDLAANAASFQPPLDVMIIPKPAGPRSPAIHGSPFFSQVPQPCPKSPLTRPWSSARSASDRSVKSPRDGTAQVLHPPSPLSIAESADYFPSGSTPATGRVIASPDGQLAGILFNPRAKVVRQSSASALSDRVNRMHLLSPNQERLRSRSPPHPSLPFATVFPSTLSQQETPSPTQTPTSTHVGENTKTRRSSVLTDDEPSAQSAAAALPRRSSTMESRKTASQPGSPNGVESPTSWFARRKAKRAALSQRLAMQGSASNKNGKGAAETMIVPPISVLIVDDNPINRTILSTFMKKKKVKYDVAKNGQEAVEKWRNGNFQLILMDIQMPVMDGIEATKEIRNLESQNAAYVPITPQSDGGLRTPPDGLRTTSYHFSVIIVALTASSLESDRVAALAAGCNDFLTKPVSLQWLNNKIIEWGAIKTLQMWADMSPDEEKTLSSEQSAQAQVVAQRLHVPDGRATPVGDSASRSSSKGWVEGSEAIPTTTLISTILPTPTEKNVDDTDDPTSTTPPRDTEGERQDRKAVAGEVAGDMRKSAVVTEKEVASSALPSLPTSEPSSSSSETCLLLPSGSDGTPELPMPQDTP
ncbi:hypothetical protein EDD16DRAFT_1548412 [Pisolithus croceorrhizus]|nr:hypothetical protein EDD16DRAFT_1548412 [Pisolithus croceorrhizus]